MRRVIPSLLLLFVATVASAEAVPQAGKSDLRIKNIDYDPSQVVLIVGREGFASDIRLNDDEKITAVAVGNSDAWWVVPINQHLILKPRADDVTTNAVVLTDKGRVYNFLLTTRNAKGKGPGAGDDQFFDVIFRYPAEAKAKADAAMTTDAVRQSLEHPKVSIKNTNFWGCGDKSVTPDTVFDDGHFTYLLFEGNRPMPAMFAVAADGSEQIVNHSVDPNSPDTVIVHQLVQRMDFRLGSAVGCIVNKSYDPRGTTNFNGTASPDVDRVVKKAGP